MKSDQAVKIDSPYIKKVVTTEKTSRIKNSNILCLLVDKSCDKEFLKKHISSKFSIDIVKITTANTPSRKRTFRRVEGFIGGSKKVYIHYSSGDNNLDNR
jgi:ribosomal protein L23